MSSAARDRSGKSYIGRRVATAVATIVAALLGSCGEAHNAGIASASAPPHRIAFWSPAVSMTRNIPEAYVCKAGIWLPLQWGEVPKDTKELVLVFEGFSAPRRVAHSPGEDLSVLISGGGIVGLSPALRGVGVGPVPAGARFVSEAHVPICSARSAGRQIVFTLYALPRGHEVTEALRLKPPSELLAAIARQATGLGEFTAGYG